MQTAPAGTRNVNWVVDLTVPRSQSVLSDLVLDDPLAQLPKRLGKVLVLGCKRDVTNAKYSG